MVPVAGTRAKGAPRREHRGGRGIPLSLGVQRGTGLELNLGKWEGKGQGVSRLENHIQRLEGRRDPGRWWARTEYGPRGEEARGGQAERECWRSRAHNGAESERLPSTGHRPSCGSSLLIPATRLHLRWSVTVSVCPMRAQREKATCPSSHSTRMSGPGSGRAACAGLG